MTVSTRNGSYNMIGVIELVTRLYLKLKTKQTCPQFTFTSGERRSIKLILVFGIPLCYTVYSNEQYWTLTTQRFVITDMSSLAALHKRDLTTGNHFQAKADTYKNVNISTKNVYNCESCMEICNEISPYKTDTTWIDFSLVPVKLSYGEVLGDKSAMYIRVTLYWGYWIVLWLFHLVCVLYCGCFNWFCNVWVCVCAEGGL